MKTSDKAIYKTIRENGEPVLNSEEFRETRNARHHRHSSISEHTMNVCIISLKLARLLKNAGISVDENDLVTASLCHDLGMMDRGHKYHSLISSWIRHPDDSVQAAHQVVPDLSKNAEDMIRSHMWPLGTHLPKTRESIIMAVADKCASVIDWGEYLTNSRYKAEIKKQLIAQYLE